MLVLGNASAYREGCVHGGPMSPTPKRPKQRAPRSSLASLLTNARYDAAGAGTEGHLNGEIEQRIFIVVAFPESACSVIARSASDEASRLSRRKRYWIASLRSQ